MNTLVDNKLCAALTNKLNMVYNSKNSISHWIHDSEQIPKYNNEL
uniref:Uncharacterized protein n=1 Tax=Setaria italica TaxID=4555 RepID=K4AN15_SETIT